MRLDQDIGDGNLVLEVGPLPGMMRIFMAADVIPGPAVSGALAHTRHVIGHEVVAEPVAFVGGAPGHPSGRLDREADAVADSGREQLLVLALGIEGENGGAVGLLAPGRAQRMRTDPLWQAARRITYALGVIAGGADRDEHARIIRREDDVAG